MWCGLLCPFTSSKFDLFSRKVHKNYFCNALDEHKVKSFGDTEGNLSCL